MWLTLLVACGRRALPAFAACQTGCTAPLVLVADVPLPGAANRFDYQAIDAEHGLLYIAHMNDAAVDVVALEDGAIVTELRGVQRARGVAVGRDFVYVTSSPDELVRIDRTSHAIIDRVPTGSSPDGVDYDPADDIVGVSDQGDGALSLLTDGGGGRRTQVQLGSATGNVRYDALRGRFWITVEHESGTDELASVVPATGAVDQSFALSGCEAAHGLILDDATAFVACEGNAILTRVRLDTGEKSTGPTGRGPDVLALDPELHRLYVAAEAGDLTIFDTSEPGVVRVGSQSVGPHAHSAAVDPATHRVYFPLEDDGSGEPVLRIMIPEDR
ncbi:MAG TPA: hypothetical protein PKA64_15990 [Myxococcota bacterium]|nr:hypothetical protein [Myxococcota bacterium]